MEELISVIVPVYNIENYVEKCVKSIIDQTYINLEIILVDDGSADNSGLLCDRLAQQDGRILVIHKKNGGLSDARNAGLDECKGVYISFVDGDDYIEPDMIEVMYNGMRGDISAVVVGFIEHDGEMISHCCALDEAVEYDKENAIRSILEEGGINESACNKLYRRAIFSSLRFKKDITSEDAEIISKVIDNCNKIRVLNCSKYHYVRRQGSLTRMPFTRFHYDSMESFHEITKLCQKKFRNLIGLSYYYELKKYYGTLADIVTFKRETHFKYFILIRLKMIGLYIKAYSDKDVMQKYGNVRLRYLVPILIGYRLSELIGNRKRVLGDQS